MEFNDMVKCQREKSIIKNFNGDIRDYVNVGDIYFTSEGYDMTLVEFYEVMAINGAQTATLRPLKVKVTNDGHSGEAVPVLGEYIGDEQRCRAVESYYNDSPVAFNVDSLGFKIKARKWDGQPKYYNSYD